MQDDRTPLERIRVEDLIGVERAVLRETPAVGLRDRGGARRLDNAPEEGEGRDQRDRDEERAGSYHAVDPARRGRAPGATETEHRARSRSKRRRRRVERSANAVA